MTAFDSILSRLSKQEIILPIFENAMRANKWPDSYMIEVDSREYYGKGDGYFHPSTHPLMDERLLYYLFHPDTVKFVTEEPYSLERDLAAGVGSSLHAMIQTMLIQTGLARPENVELTYINEDHHIRGRIDVIVDHPTRGRILVEIKSRTHYKFGKQDAPLPEWEAQLSIALDWAGLENGVILMVETGYPFRMKEFQVARNDALLSQIYQKFDRVREAISLNRTPVPCCAPNSPTASSCPAKFACWSHPDGPR